MCGLSPDDIIIGDTPDYSEIIWSAKYPRKSADASMLARKQRCMEILGWVKTHIHLVNKFIAIDDLELSAVKQYADIFSNHLVREK